MKTFQTKITNMLKMFRPNLNEKQVKIIMTYLKSDVLLLAMYLRILEKHVSNIITLIKHIITGISLGCMCQTSGTWQTIAPSHQSEIYFTQVWSALHAKQEKIKGNRLQFEGRFGSRSLHKAETDQESTFHQQMLQRGWQN